MPGKSQGSVTEWGDPDDAPELTDDVLDRGARFEGGEAVETVVDRVEKARDGRPRSEAPKRQVTLRPDADLVEALRATGKGWQTRVNALLRRDVLGE